MRTFAVALLIALAVAGCAGPGTKQLIQAFSPATSQTTTPNCEVTTKAHSSIFFAEPVCDRYFIKDTEKALSAADADGDTTADTGANLRVKFVSAALFDSRTKCQNFIDDFTGRQAVDNTGFDVLALALSGLASTFTSLTVARDLAAASTAVQGTKQTINTDLYQQMTMQIFVQQINQAYFNKLDADFPTTSFPPQDPTKFSASAALSTIQAVHRNCSIPFAVANVNTVQAAGASTSAPKWTITVTAAPADISAGDTVTVKSSSSVAGFSPLSVPEAVAAGDTAATIAGRLEGNAAFGVAGFSVSPVTQAGTNAAQFTIQGGPPDISWAGAVTGHGHETVAAVAVTKS